MDKSTIARPNRIDGICASTAAEIDLYGPLVEFLTPTVFDMDLRGEPLDGREITLQKNQFVAQFDAGIDRCVGLSIAWAE